MNMSGFQALLVVLGAACLFTPPGPEQDTKLAVSPSTEQNRAKQNLIVTIEVPGVTCTGRFGESLQKNFVKKESWIQSLQISYQPNSKDGVKTIKASWPYQSTPIWGETAVLKFNLSDSDKKQELIKRLHDCNRYAGVKAWTIVHRQTIGEILGDTK